MVLDEGQKMKRISLFALLLLSGCFATAEPLYLPDGSSGYHISCGNYVGTPADCIEKAGEMCGTNGYQMFDQAGHPLNAEAQNQAVIAALNTTAKTSHSTDSQQNMFVKCKSIEAPLHITPALTTPKVDAMPITPMAPVTPPAPAPVPGAATSAPIPLENK